MNAPRLCTRTGAGVLLSAALLLPAAALAESSLPLRTDSVIGLGDVVRIALSLVLLLGITSALLWLYQRRFGRLPPGFSRKDPEIECIARLRLSPRTQVFVLRRHGQEFLVTESGSGATTVPVVTGTAPQHPPAVVPADTTGGTP